MIIYADTSALAKLLLEEVGSQDIRDAARAADGVVSVSIAYAELRAAVGAAFRDGRIPIARRPAARDQIERIWRQVDEIDVDAPLIRAAGDLAETLSLRGYDAVHLAGLTRLPPNGEIAFACWDAQLRSAARGLGYALIPD